MLGEKPLCAYLHELIDLHASIRSVTCYDGLYRVCSELTCPILECCMLRALGSSVGNN